MSTLKRENMERKLYHQYSDHQRNVSMLHRRTLV